MAKNTDDIILFNGTVTEVLPNATFRVRLENSHTILTYLSGKLRLHCINVMLGDDVQVEMSTYDLSKGRIVYRIGKGSSV